MRKKTVFARHKVNGGVEYRDSFRIDQGGSQLEPYILYFQDARRSHTTAAFVEDQYAIHEKLLLNAGFRYDHYADFGGTTNPRLGLIFKPAHKTAVKAVWGSAFRAPNAYELFYTSSLIQSNTRLRPETIRTGELILEHYFADHYRLMVNGYSSRIHDLISQLPTGEGDLVFRNLDSAKTRGLEFELEGKGWSGISARASYSIQQATDTNTDLPLTNSPRHLATANVAVPLNHALQVGAALRFVGRVQTLNGTDAPASAVPDLIFSTRESDKGGLAFTAGIYNVFNSRYGNAGFEEHRQNIIYQDGRTFRAGLRYTWSFGDR